jgi:hypothetical protein
MSREAFSLIYVELYPSKRRASKPYLTRPILARIFQPIHLNRVGGQLEIARNRGNYRQHLVGGESDGR